MIWKPEEVLETIRMVSSEHLDIRTVTMGISLLGAPSKEPEALCQFIRTTIRRNAERLIPICNELEERYGVPITNKSVIPKSGCCIFDADQLVITCRRPLSRLLGKVDRDGDG